MLKKIGFQGDFGANSDLACRDNFPNYQTIPYKTFDDVFTAVSKKEVELGMIPLENTYAGRVAEIHNILKETKLYITGEYFQDINHCLAVNHGNELANVTEILSHPQALMQCHKQIRKNDFTKTSFLNTAIAAKYLADNPNQSKAVICSKLAAEIYGLEVLQEHYEDVSQNRTIFVTIADQLQDHQDDDIKMITSLLFKVRNIPAAIFKALGGFSTNNVNIIKLESYIPGGVSREAEFFISFEGSPDQANVSLALEELGFFTKRIKLLGVYPQSEKRINLVASNDSN